MITLITNTFTIDAAADGSPKRTITGIAVPYNVIANASGTEVMFAPGSLPTEGKKPKLYMSHDSSQAIGLVTERVDSIEAMYFSAKVSTTALGDEALILAADGVLDSVSVGVNPTKFTYNEDGVMVVEAGDWIELSLVPSPAFAGAIITKVAASSDANLDNLCNNENGDSGTAIKTNEEIPVATPEVIAPEVIEASAVFATAKKHFVMPTAAEYISAAFVGGNQWLEMNEGIRAAAPNVVTTDIPGVLPLPIVQPVYNNFVGRRPVIDAIGAKAMPQGGKVFIRPEVTTHTSIAVQSAENAALQDGTFVITDNQVTKAAYGGYVTLSEQSIDWSSPEIIGLLLDDMGRIYANSTDNVAADNLKTGATTTRAFTAASATDPSYWSSWIAGAASTILSASNGNLPTHLFLSPDYWAVLLGLADTSKRPMFPQIGPMNAFGNLTPGQPNGVAFGLSVVVDRNFADNTIIVGDASGYEIFEQQKGALSIDVPSTMSRTISFRGYLATLMIDASKFVKATMA